MAGVVFEEMGERGGGEEGDKEVDGATCERSHMPVSLLRLRCAGPSAQRMGS